MLRKGGLCSRTAIFQKRRRVPAVCGRPACWALGNLTPNPSPPGGEGNSAPRLLLAEPGALRGARTSLVGRSSERC